MDNNYTSFCDLFRSFNLCMCPYSLKTPILFFMKWKYGLKINALYDYDYDYEMNLLRHKYM